MKTVKYILGVLVMFITMTTFYSCKDEAPVYDPAEKVNNDQVFFPNTNSSTIKASSLATSFDVAIARVKTDGAISVPLTLTGGDGQYSIPASVSFNAGQAATSIKVTYDPEKIGFDNFSDLVISIGEAFKTPYGLTDYPFNVGIPAPWKSLGKGTFIDDFVSAFYGVGNVAWEVEIQENELQPGFFRVVNPYAKDYPYNDAGDWDTSKDYYFEIHAENPDAVYINVQETGMDWGYGKFLFGSLAGYYMSRGETLEKQITEKRVGTFKDGIISFPPKTLVAGMANYNAGALRVANGKGAFMVLMPGVVLADYSINVTYLGRFTNTKDKNFVVADVEFGDDVESAKVALVAGKDINAAIAGIMNGSIESQEIEEGGELMFANDVDGTYSLVAVSYGGGEAQEVDYQTFDFKVGGIDVVNPATPVIKRIKSNLKIDNIGINLPFIK